LGNSKKLLQSEINKLSNNKDWKKIRLGDFFDLYQPKTISGNQILLKGSYKVYGANGVIGFYEKYNHEDEEVLMTCRGATCGTINISEKKSWINGNAMIIRPKKSNISKYFIAYILTSIDKIKAISGAAQPQITRKSLSPLEIPIPFVGDRPNTKEQKRIVIKLDKISDELKLLLEKYQNQLSNFNKLKQSILNYALAGKL